MGIDVNTIDHRSEFYPQFNGFFKKLFKINTLNGMPKAPATMDDIDQIEMNSKNG